MANQRFILQALPFGKGVSGTRLADTSGFSANDGGLPCPPGALHWVRLFGPAGGAASQLGRRAHQEPELGPALGVLGQHRPCPRFSAARGAGEIPDPMCSGSLTALVRGLQWEEGTRGRDVSLSRLGGVTACLRKLCFSRNCHSVMTGCEEQKF